jgi:hypothetical protein
VVSSVVVVLVCANANGATSPQTKAMIVLFTLMPPFYLFTSTVRDSGLKRTGFSRGFIRSLEKGGTTSATSLLETLPWSIQHNHVIDHTPVTHVGVKHNHTRTWFNRTANRSAKPIIDKSGSV